MTKSRFYTDEQGRIRYIGSSDIKRVTSDVPLTAPRRDKGNFITTDEGRVVFTGGPGSGGGTAGGSAGQTPTASVIPPLRNGFRVQMDRTGNYTIHGEGYSKSRVPSIVDVRTQKVNDKIAAQYSTRDPMGARSSWNPLGTFDSLTDIVRQVENMIDNKK